MDATNPSRSPLQSLTHSALSVGTTRPTARTVVVHYKLTPIAPAFVDFSLSRMPRDELLAATPSTKPPHSFLIILPALDSTVQFNAPPRMVLSAWGLLKGIHEFLHLKAPNDLLRRPEHAGATNQFFTRLRSIEDPEERWVELQKGIKHVDLLRGEHVFAGLSNAGAAWILLLRE